MCLLMLVFVIFSTRENGIEWQILAAAHGTQGSR